MEKHPTYLKLFAFICILLISAGLLTTNARAQTNLSNSQLLQGLMEGALPLETVAGQVAQQAGIDVSQAETILENIQTLENLEFSDAVSFLTDLTSGQIDGAIAEFLSEIPELGQITEIAEIAELLQSGAIVEELQSRLLELGAQAVQEQIANILQIAGGAEALQQALSEAGAEAIAEALQNVAPELVEALGGEEALTDALSSLIGEVINITPPTTADPGICNGCNGDQDRGPTTFGSSCSFCSGIGSGCSSTITSNHNRIREHVTTEFENHRTWLENVFWKEHILPALTKMNIQFSTMAVQQVSMIGQFFDAKHQLETQRLLQRLSAQAYKDYTPSEGLCEFGTNTRSLGASAQKSDLVHQAVANRQIARNIRAKDTLSYDGTTADKSNRRAQFVTNYCDKSHNANNLSFLCKDSTPNPSRINKDIDYTRTFGAPLTLNVDMSNDGGPTEETNDLFALSANLYAHDVIPAIAARRLADNEGFPRQEAYDYINYRAIAAKRSVAMNSFAAIAGLKASGDEEVAPFLKRVVTEMGVPNNEVEYILGEKPSYHAQMEVLTKKILQNPVFYTELYDKPANVRRKGVTMRALNLMQERDIYNSLLRSEAILAVTLETMLDDEQKRIQTKFDEAPLFEDALQKVDK